jgi:hypothetical protein
MNSGFRRYEILLPLKFNDGAEVPDELVSDTLTDLRVRFNSVSSETQTIRGQWVHQGQTYVDDLLRVFVDVPDSPEAADYFRRYKEELKTRFQQVEIWLVSYPIDIV